MMIDLLTRLRECVDMEKDKELCFREAMDFALRSTESGNMKHLKLALDNLERQWLESLDLRNRHLDSLKEAIRHLFSDWELP
jgi:hypothetical protein